MHCSRSPVCYDSLDVHVVYETPHTAAARTTSANEIILQASLLEEFIIEHEHGYMLVHVPFGPRMKIWAFLRCYARPCLHLSAEIITQREFSVN